MKFVIGIFFILITPFLMNSNSSTNEDISPGDFKHYICYRTYEKMIIDGKLDEDSWGKAAFTKKFIDIEGKQMPSPTYNTWVKMLWDDNYLYLSAKLEEPHIWATYTERESIIFHENDFEIFIDPNGDTHNYYEIEVNALNTIWDLLLTKPYRDHGKPVNSWNVAAMKSAVHLEGTINDPSDVDEFWSVEFALPWSSLIEFARDNKKPEDGEQWRINFSRVQWKRNVVDGHYKKQINLKTGKPYSESNWVWSQQGVINMHQPETWGYLQFSELIVGTKPVEFSLATDELAKWELRKIYYAQKQYFLQNNRYEENPDLFVISMKNCMNPLLRIKADENDFEARLECAATPKKWFIRKDGLVWSE